MKMNSKAYSEKKVETVPQSDMKVQSNRFVITRHTRAATSTEAERRNEMMGKNISNLKNHEKESSNSVTNINSPRRLSNQKFKFNISYQSRANCNSNSNHSCMINENNDTINDINNININVSNNMNATSTSSITTTLMNFPSPDSLLSSVIANNTAPLSKSNGSILNSTNGSSFCCSGNRFNITRVPKTTTNSTSTTNTNNLISEGLNNNRAIGQNNGATNNNIARKNGSRIVFLDTINEELSTSPTTEDTNCSNYDPLIDIF